jgi:hypothetical protein
MKNRRRKQKIIAAPPSVAFSLPDFSPTPIPANLSHLNLSSSVVQPMDRAAERVCSSAARERLWERE